jgi:hypothetical protein
VQIVKLLNTGGVEGAADMRAGLAKSTTLD